MASLELLERHGMHILPPEARKLLATAGFEVDHKTAMVRCDPELVLDELALAEGIIEMAKAGRLCDAA